jgi:hypothetical protein
MPRRIGLAAAAACLVPLACVLGMPAAQVQAVGQPYTGSMEFHSSLCSAHVTMPARFVRSSSTFYEYQAAYVGPGGFVGRIDPLVGADVRFLFSSLTLVRPPSVTEDVLIGGSAARPLVSQWTQTFTTDANGVLHVTGNFIQASPIGNCFYSYAGSFLPDTLGH